MAQPGTHTRTDRLLLALEEPRYDMLGGQRSKAWVAEEGRHRNQQIAEQRLRLLHIVAEEREIVVQCSLRVICVRRAIRRITVDFL